MDESSAGNIKKEVNLPSQAKLAEELNDPLAFMPETTLTVLRKKRRRQAIAMIMVAVGLPLFIYIFDKLVFPNGSHVTGLQASKNGIGGLILIALLVYLGLRGLYDAMTIDKAIADNKRRGLLLLHPELQDIETQRQRVHKDSPWPKRVIWIILLLPLVYTLLFFVALRLGVVTAN